MTGTATDTATGVSFDAGTGDGGSGGNGDKSGESATGTLPTGSEAGNGGGDAAKWYDGVKDPDLKAFAAGKNWSDIEASLKSHKELETAYSAKGAAAKAPADISEYKFDIPADLPKDAYNEQFAGAFKQWAKDADLPVEAAGKLHNSFVSWAKDNMTASAKADAEALSTRVGDAAKALEGTWGKLDSVDFKRNSEMARRAIVANKGVADALVQMGALVKIEGVTKVADAAIMQAFAKMGHAMYAEDSLHGSGGTEKNPFDAKSEDLAMQGRIMKADPQKAALMIRAAGREKMFSQFLERVTSGR